MGEAGRLSAPPSLEWSGSDQPGSFHSIASASSGSTPTSHTVPQAPSLQAARHRDNSQSPLSTLCVPVVLVCIPINIVLALYPQPTDVASRRFIMSLFGESPPRETQVKSSLFDDRPANKPGAGLFADEGPNGSPWDMPTPKKNARRNLVKSLLASTDVPDKYIETFDALLEKDGGAGGSGNVSVATLRDFVGQCRINPADAGKVIEIVAGGGATALGRSEVNVLLALIGLAQEDEELSLDAVDERKNRQCPSIALHIAIADIYPGLPVPSVPNVRPPKSAQPAPSASQSIPYQAPAPKGPQQQQSFGALESDPWGSPALHKGHDHTRQEQSTPFTNGAGVPQRTTSGFTTSTTGASDLPSSADYVPAAPPAVGGEASGWGGETPFAAGDVGFGGASQQPGGDTPSDPRPIGAGKRTGSSIEEEISIHLLEEKEGVFLFQHRNYEISSTRKNSKVVRRYSDFVWLLDCLHKRYPFRQLPLLPPKRVASECYYFMRCPRAS